MKISVVTISFNQAEFLERTILSVIGQQGVDFEYIIVDPGSTDGSRELIEKYRDVFSAAIMEPDAGPADGLNKGFARATGDIFFYLNSDDTLEPDAFATAVREFERDPSLDILCGHGWIVDEHDKRLRRVWSDPWNPRAVAYGAAFVIQPSTYFRAEAFRKIGGFNDQNRLSWDGELFVDFCLSGAKHKILNAFMSNYRVHAESLTGGGGDLDKRYALRWAYYFPKIMGREAVPADKYLRYFWWLYRQARNPRAFFERLFFGPIYGRAADSSR